MRRTRGHAETHLVKRIGWMRAAVLGANDGIVSTSSLLVGVAAAGATTSAVLTAGIAGLVAGAMSMAAGEYVSVSSQSDTERADLARETRELAADPEAERQELASIYVDRGLDKDLALQVADQFMKKDALVAHARDELGITEITKARPIQAALTSAVTFAVGAALPLAAAAAANAGQMLAVITIASLVALTLLGAAGAKAGNASIARSVIRVVFWGAVALAVTAGVGALFGTIV
jgi:VIT1/CCC1 family predicted Fe2+/Mn2+ transporter